MIELDDRSIDRLRKKKAAYPATHAGSPPRYLPTLEAASFVGLSKRTLEKHRIYGTGPRYSKLGGRVVYRVDDLQTWVVPPPSPSAIDYLLLHFLDVRIALTG